MMKQLWAPWRMAYIDEGSKAPGCVFCENLKHKDSREVLVITQTRHSMVMLNKYPYNNGHLLLAPKRHESELIRLPAEEYVDLSEALRKSVEVIRHVLKPGGVNLGMNLGHTAGAGIEDHLHWHVVPRWDGDTNFMPVIAETKVMPQHLLDSYDRLKSHFENLSAITD
ncbi:MAG TPA: HIT domain-containing protein [Candidatus Binatia bacterium]